MPYLNKLLKYRKKNFKIYDINKDYIPKFSVFKKKFNYNRQTSKKFSLFYGNLLNKYLKKKCSTAIKKNKNIHNSNLFLIEMLESRLDTILYRSHFTLSIRTARQLISHNHVYINKSIVKSNSYMLKKGDLIEINSKYHHLIDKNFSQSNLWPLPSKHLQINYKTFQIIFNDDVKYSNLSTDFPFYLDVNTILKYYNQ